jgi:Derlin-2/3
MEIPVISRLYFTGAFLTTAACAVDMISPYNLYFNWDLIFSQGQVWRLVTTYLFFGMFSVDFMFHMYFLVRYCRLLEEGDFRGRTANFLLFLIFGITMMTLVAPFVSVNFLGSSLTFMMVYVWGRRNTDVRMSFLGVFTFNAPYLPWVMLTFSVLLGNPVTMDVIGIMVGHTYYFLEYIYPVIADIRGWDVKRIMNPPRLLHWICGTYQEPLHLHQD